jgi:hypothetical protein
MCFSSMNAKPNCCWRCPKFKVIARAEQLAGKIEVELSVVKRSMILVRLMGLGYGAENLA